MGQDNTGNENPIAPADASTTNENKSETTNQITVEPVTPTPPIVDPATPPSTPPTEPKKPKALIATTIILAILALAGVAFGVYGMFFQPKPSCETNCTEPTNNNAMVPETVKEKDAETEPNTAVIDNAVAQTIADPYLKPFGTFNNSLDADFDILSKIKITVDNTAIYAGLRASDSTIIMPYYRINETYKYLFGRDSELEKKSYNPPYLSKFDYSDDVFYIEASGIGGTGGAMFSIVKESYYDGDNLIVEVYHDNIPWCAANENGGYCYNAEPMTTQATLEDGNMKEVTEKFSDKIPVYTMTFAKDIDHYVLKEVQKNSE